MRVTFLVMASKPKPSENVAETRHCPGKNNASLEIQSDTAGIYESFQTVHSSLLSGGI